MFTEFTWLAGEGQTPFQNTFLGISCLLRVKTAKLPWRSNGRTLTLGRDDGMSKIIVDPENDRSVADEDIAPRRDRQGIREVPKIVLRAKDRVVVLLAREEGVHGGFRHRLVEEAAKHE